MALSLDEALGMSLADEADESIHVDIDTRQITIPESQKLFGVESDADVEVKHIVIDGRYADGNRDLSKLAWRVVYRNAKKESGYYLIPSVVANKNSIDMDWLIKRSVVAYKGTVDFILCAFATTSSGEVTPEWNSTLGQGIVLKGLETSAIDIGKESVDELSKILYETITAKDAAAKSASDAQGYMQTASAAATDANASAENAAVSKAAAENSASAAAGSEQAAAESKAAAQEAATEAERSAGIASDAADGSALNAENAQKSANNAAESQSEAKANADAAAKSQQSAAIDAKTASDAKVAAAGSADAAAGSANAAENSASAAAGSEQAAGASELKAAESEKAAKASEQAAAESAQAALESKTAAATSEVNAAASAKKAQDVADSLPEDYTTAVNEIAALKQQVANITPDDSTIGGKPWSSKRIIDMFCPPLEESGNPVVCYPVAGYPLGVKASWEPVQEGSGTPYPAGGGKQLLDTNKCVPTVGKPYGMTITLDGDVFKVSGVPNEEVTATESYSFAVCTCNQEELRGKGYKVTAWAIKGKVNNAWGLRTESESSLAIAAELTPGVNNDIQLRLMVSKDTPTAWEPYENIRPVMGRASVTVERCGENLLNISQLKPNGYNLAGSNTLKPNTTYTFKPVSCGGIAFAVFLADNIVSSQTTKQLNLTSYINEGKSATFTTPSNADSYSVMWLAGGKSGIHLVYPNVQFMLVPGTTAPTTYTPYTGQTDTLTLPETVYGGEVDAVSGEGQETWQVKSLDGTEGWDIRDTYIGIYGLLSPTDSGKGICTHFDVKRSYSGDCIFISDSGTVYLGRALSDKYTVDTWCAYLAAQHEAGTPVQICYKLEEPIPFTATGAQPLPALAGTNTILTDADSATVTGRADPIKRITDLEDAVASQT